ncbi:hypothetical protein E4414_14195 [Leptospira interrogans]|nr:hypothetical protein E4414_14195 [Leptospira interrogans]
MHPLLISKACPGKTLPYSQCRVALSAPVKKLYFTFRILFFRYSNFLTTLRSTHAGESRRILLLLYI